MAELKSLGRSSRELLEEADLAIKHADFLDDPFHQFYTVDSKMVDKARLYMAEAEKCFTDLNIGSAENHLESALAYATRSVSRAPAEQNERQWQ